MMSANARGIAVALLVAAVLANPGASLGRHGRGCYGGGYGNGFGAIPGFGAYGAGSSYYSSFGATATAGGVGVVYPPGFPIDGVLAQGTGAGSFGGPGGFGPGPSFGPGAFGPSAPGTSFTPNTPVPRPEPRRATDSRRAPPTYTPYTPQPAPELASPPSPPRPPAEPKTIEVNEDSKTYIVIRKGHGITEIVR